MKTLKGKIIVELIKEKTKINTIYLNYAKQYSIGKVVDVHPEDQTQLNITTGDCICFGRLQLTQIKDKTTGKIYSIIPIRHVLAKVDDINDESDLHNLIIDSDLCV
jgi:co-chaperonin GroES (HSP10)